MKYKRLILVFVLSLILIVALAMAASAENDGKWIAAWGTGSANISLNGYDNITSFTGYVTIRTVITPTASGDKLRVRLSNHFGNEPLTLNSVTVAKSLGGSKIDTASVRILTFNNAPSVTIPAGAEIYSDEIPFKVTAMQDIALSVWLNNFRSIKTMGFSGGETYLSVGEEDKTRAADMGIANTIDDTFLRIFESVGIGLDRSLSYSIIHVVPLFSSVDVYNSSSDAYSVVVIGDTTVSNDFPKYLADQINQKDITDVGVVGKGLIGNSLGRDGLGFGSFLFGESMMKRFERDVLSHSGVKYVVMKIGLNDIVHPVCQDVMEENPGIRQPTAQEIIEKFRTVFTFCHQNNIKVVVIGITQWKGYTRNFLNTGARYVRTNEEFAADYEIALTVNSWLSNSTEHDGYVEYSVSIMNPEDPEAMLPEYTLDGAHPTDFCQRVWASEFPLGLIGIGEYVGGVRLNKSVLCLQPGETHQLTAAVFPANLQDSNVSWSSSDCSVATVDENGLVCGMDTGTCKSTCVITASIGENTGRACCLVNVVVPHVPGDWIIAKTPTCTEEGNRVQKCTVCKQILNEETIPQNGHSVGDWTIEQNPTCTQSGYRVCKCTVCNERLKGEKIPAAGHTFGPWKTFRSVDEDQAGIDVRFCSVCGYYELRESEVTGPTTEPPEEPAEPTQQDEEPQGFFAKIAAFFRNLFDRIFGVFRR